MGHGLTESVVRRFWKHTRKRGPDQCWPWLGGKKEDGYGRLFLRRGKYLFAHRISFAIATNTSLESLIVVRHKCDNPRCVNPKHLLHGTILDNVADRQSRNRQTRGENHFNAKLTELQAEEIRRIHVPYRRPYLRELAKRYGVTLDQVHRVARKKSWRHI